MEYVTNKIEIRLKTDNHTIDRMLEAIMVAMAQLKSNCLPTRLSDVVEIFSLPDNMSSMLNKLANGHNNDAEALRLTERLLEVLFKAFDNCDDLNYYVAIFEYETLRKPTPMSVLWDM